MTVTKEITTHQDGSQTIKETLKHPDGRIETKMYDKELPGSQGERDSYDVNDYYNPYERNQNDYVEYHTNNYGGYGDNSYEYVDMGGLSPEELEAIMNM